MRNLKDEAAALIDRYLAGTCTDQERKLVESVYSKSALAKVIEEKSLDFTQIGEESWLRIAAATFSPAAGIAPAPVKHIRSLWPRIAAAASILLVLGAGIWFYTSRQSADSNLQTTTQNQVLPGKNTATLTLANGKTIILSDAKTGVIIDAAALTYNDGSSIMDSVLSSSSLTASTPRGGTYQITLPDGTKVWLNAASTLKFPSTFAGLTQRKVILSGEAYFEVSKSYLPNSSKKQSFIVETTNQSLEVLGTHFNVNSYADDPNTKTTLLEGSVRITPLLAHNTPVTLKPGQQSVLADNDLAVNTIDPEEAVAWKKGFFSFDNENLESVMKKIARWYNIEVFYADPAVKAETFYGSFSRFESFATAIKTIQRTGVLKLELKGNKVYISKNK